MPAKKAAHSIKANNRGRSWHCGLIAVSFVPPNRKNNQFLCRVMLSIYKSNNLLLAVSIFEIQKSKFVCIA